MSGPEDGVQVLRIIRFNFHASICFVIGNSLLGTMYIDTSLQCLCSSFRSNLGLKSSE